MGFSIQGLVQKDVIPPSPTLWQIRLVMRFWCFLFMYFHGLFAEDGEGQFVYVVGVYLAFINFLHKAFSLRLYLHIHLVRRGLFFYFIENRPCPPLCTGRFMILHHTRCGPSFHK